MYTLHKHSAPGWSKKFDTLEALTTAVYEETCGGCIDSFGTDLSSMLASDCGCEYSVEGLKLDGPMTLAEQWQDFLRGLV